MLLAAISPQTQRQSDFMVGQHALPFPVLADPGCAVAEQFGLAYTVPDYHRDYYRSILINIPFVNGDESWRLILPATYVISPAGRVVLRPGARRLPRAGPSRKRFGRRVGCGRQVVARLFRLRCVGLRPVRVRLCVAVTRVLQVQDRELIAGAAGAFAVGLPGAT